MKEIRISLKDIMSHSMDMKLLQAKGFPVDPITLDPKKGLKYFEFLDPKTDEIVVQWEEHLDNDSPPSVEK